MPVKDRHTYFSNTDVVVRADPFQENIRIQQQTESIPKKKVFLRKLIYSVPHSHDIYR
jgi:hypothetical protein